MKHPDSLKEIERRAYRTTFDDGLYDIVFGLAFLVLAWITSMDSVGVPAIYGYIMLVILPLIPLLGKRFVSTPRLGAVEFGMKRRSKKRFLLVLCAAVVFMQMPILMLAFSEGAFGMLGQSLATPVMVVMVIAPLLLIAAYFIDYPRLYVYAAILFFTVPNAAMLSRFVGHPAECLISFGIPGLAILGFGLALLAQFMKRYPLTTPEANHAC